MRAMALPGLGGLQETLRETNALLTAVLEELRQTNQDHLANMSAELRELNTKLDQTNT